MSRRIFIGTAAGLWTLEGETSREVETFAGHAVTALAIDADAAWAIIAGSSLWELRERAWRRRTALEGPRATCLAPARDGLLVGTEQAHLLRVTDAGVARIEAFETVEGREGSSQEASASRSRTEYSTPACEPKVASAAR